MPDLHLAPPGETNRLPSILVAAVVFLVVAAAVYFFLPKSTASVSVEGVQTFAPHTTFNAVKNNKGINVIGQQAASEDTLYVVLTVSIKDTFRMPVSVDAASATLTTSDDVVHEGKTVARSDLPRLAEVFPELAPLAPHPLAFDDEIKPGESIERQVMVMFPGLNADAWKTKKELTLKVSMHNQPPQIVVLH